MFSVAQIIFVLNDRMILNWKGYGRKWSWSNWKYHSGIFLEGLRKATKNLGQSLDQDLNLGPPKYIGMLTT
jgi:hypothetical protein